MNRNNHFEKLLNFLKNKDVFDVIIVGGGITGAGIAVGCARNNLKTLLVEAKDFGYSSSGNSSKLVHGGLRYLQNGQFHITYHSVREREKLLKELPDLIWPMYFALPYYNLKEKLMYKFGLMIYDLFAGKKYHKSIKLKEIEKWFPYIRKYKEKNQKNYYLQGGYLYQDAQTDDVRLLIRTLKEAENSGAIIINYLKAKDLIIENDSVNGIIAYDEITNKDYFIKAKIVINATGYLADEFREKLGLKKIMRPLRGSHIVIPYEKLPIKYALGFKHPEDKRNIFVLPWFGKTIIGTTDVDHKINQQNNISASQITNEEIDYLLKGINFQFPDAHITKEDIYSTWSGVRPVVSKSTNKDPSKESRDMFIEFYKNLLTVTGGKLTTFRLEAKKVLKTLKRIFPIKTMDLSFKNILSEDLKNYFNEEEYKYIEEKIPDYKRILSFYGIDSIKILKNILQNPDKVTEFNFYSWNKKNYIYKEELKYCIENEWIVNWEDLFYRRFRFGIVKKEEQQKLKLLLKI